MNVCNHSIIKSEQDHAVGSKPPRAKVPTAALMSNLALSILIWNLPPLLIHLLFASYLHSVRSSGL